MVQKIKRAKRSSHFAAWSKASVRFAYLLCALSIALFANVAFGDELEDGFAKPPSFAKPQTWWHWMNGNISTEERLHGPTRFDGILPEPATKIGCRREIAVLAFNTKLQSKG